jgi:hypothetical protein
MNMERIPKKILYSTIGGRRRAGKRRNRWMDAVEEDAKKLMGIGREKRRRERNGGLYKGGQGPISGCCAIERF